MFKKPPANVGPSTALRSSDRRKLVNAVHEQYPDLSAEAAKKVVPDGIKSGKVLTSGEVQGMIYSSTEGEPLWLTFGRNSNEYVPTLYATIIPDVVAFLPLIPLHSPPPPPFVNTGAPLFIPAVHFLSNPWLLPLVEENRYVAYFIPDEPSQHANDGDVGMKGRIIGIGRMVAKGGLAGAYARWQSARRTEQSKISGGVQDVGRVCETINMVGDTLWEMGSESELPSIAYPYPSVPLVPASNSSSNPPRETASSTQTTNTDDCASNAGAANNDKPSDSVNYGEPEPKNELSVSQIDDYLNSALHQALGHLTNATPIPASSLYSGHILPSRPAAIPAQQREDVVVGKSSWRKLAKWMKVAEKEGILKAKEGRGGEITVTTIHSDHPAIALHRQHKTIAKEEEQMKRATVTTDNADHSSNSRVPPSAKDKGKNSELSIEEVWKPNGVNVGFWEVCGVDKNRYLTHRDIQDHIDKYIQTNSLAKPQNRALIRLDEALAKSVGLVKPKSDMPSEEIALRKEKIVEKMKGEMVEAVRLGGEHGSIRKGNLVPVTITVKVRAGKKVTVISGVETFDVDPEQMAEELKRICAGSTTVGPLAGSKQSLGLKEISVQGPQAQAVTDLLVSKGVPRRYIKDLGSGKAKGGK
ncbi:hypothetical protein QFC22_001735 [Naganishia vaughanmartiniae]|uniref:Uncharacterized protein n=1 Tax=Naganishia vaughanmartiniae TaxID=1424756 RepID=A0ACC2XFV5_9TREE|nr:hypothetical protein QFC22_001735 [Naganishia vaughanmartiniae]